MGLMLVIFGRQFLSLFTNDPEVVEGGNVPDLHYGIFLRNFRVYGLYHCGFQGIRKESGADGGGDHGFLCVPDHMGVHGICLFPHHSVPVSVVQLLLSITGLVEILYFIHVYREKVKME